MRTLFLVSLLALSAAASPALAKDWVVDYGASHLGFIGTESGESFEGMFKKFDAAINFDPAHPETGKITANIDIASVSAGNYDRDSNLPQPDWFDTAKFPKAEFATTGIKADATPSCYVASATLTIKGMTKPVMLPFCLTPEGDHSRAKGKLTISRKDFGVGTGQWADEGTVKHAVTITVDIAAK